VDVDPEIYRRQAAAVFGDADYEEWGAGDEVAEQLEAILEIGDGFLEQGQLAAAAAVYRPVLEEVLENYETFQDEEGSLGGVVTSCVSGLGACLAGTGEEVETRRSLLEALFAVFKFDVEYGGIGLSDEVPELIRVHATAEERQAVAGWVREALAGGKRDWGRSTYGAFLLALEAETLDDEGYLRICRETGQTHDLVERLLELGRLDEAVEEVRRAGDYALLGLADLLVRHDHGDVAESLVRERSEKTEDTRVLEWLKKRYLERDDKAAALELAERIFLKFPSLAGYQEIRGLARPLGEWDAVRPELLKVLEAPQYSDLLVRIALDEGEIDRALELVNASPPRSPLGLGYGYGFLSGSLKLEVAKAAEESRPRAALEIYRGAAEENISARGRDNYQSACGFLKRVRALHERLGEQKEWERYIARLRDENRSLRALKEELAAAGL
jgi:hypothetical protein